MKFVQPTVHMIARTALYDEGMQNFLDELGVGNWDTNAPSDAEKLIEVSGKTCYMSFDTSLNKNLTRVRENRNQEYIKNLIDVNHGSVLEHATVTFAFCNVSRIFTHELVRHRAGCAYSQQSGRYVRPDELECYKPTEAGLTEEEMKELEENLAKIEIMYGDLETKVFKRLDEEGSDFGVKKKVTSALRRQLPNGQNNVIIFTANHRALRHIIDMRTAPGAEEEIILVFTKVAQILKAAYPNIYFDVEV